MRKAWPWILALAVLAAYPLVPGAGAARLGAQIRDILVFSILALGLNVIVGSAGLLNLGVAAFFGIGAYITGILTVEQFPFRFGFWPALACSAAGTALAGILLAAPTLRLRGDYLAIVTLGFGEVVRFAIRNLENITNGARSLNPLPSPWFFGVPARAWDDDYRPYYYLALVLLAGVVVLLLNLDRSRLGRAWRAIREDELAATCMGVNAAAVKLSAFALGSALAGVAGALYAVVLDQTSPDYYNFNLSITVLCFLIIGGMGSVPGALIGTAVLRGYENLLTPALDGWIQQAGAAFRFTDVKLIVYGLVLILMMRFRPQGIWRGRNVQGSNTQ